MKHEENRVFVFDTTARDGKQAPGNQFGPEETVLLAQQLAKMGVDMMEAGFPISSPSDFAAVQSVATRVPGIRCCALARARQEDIDAAGRALNGALEPPRIHVFIASSDEHIRAKFKKSPEEVIDMTVAAVKLARTYVDDVEFSPEDASRTGFAFLKRIVHAAVEAGANTINIPDTVGYAVGNEFGNMIRRLISEVPSITERNVVISVHCHNDLEHAVANALAGLHAGARQVECTINGIGERAGNAHMASMVMSLHRREDYFGLHTGIRTQELGPTARLLSQILNKPIPDALPIVGKNVFAHGSGIHQDGVAKSRATYEIMQPEDVGWNGEMFPLTSQSGRRGLSERLSALGYTLDTEALSAFYDRFIEFAGTVVSVHDTDVHLLMQEYLGEAHADTDAWVHLARIAYSRTEAGVRSATVTLQCGGEQLRAEGSGNGPVNAATNAIEKALSDIQRWPHKARLGEFSIGKRVGGTEALGVASIRVDCNGTYAYGRGADTDIVVASAKAVVAALNHLQFSPITR